MIMGNKRKNIKKKKRVVEKVGKRDPEQPFYSSK
jgi:hypothetical protein